MAVARPCKGSSRTAAACQPGTYCAPCSIKANSLEAFHIVASGSLVQRDCGARLGGACPPRLQYRRARRQRSQSIIPVSLSHRAPSESPS